MSNVKTSTKVSLIPVLDNGIVQIRVVGIVTCLADGVYSIIQILGVCRVGQVIPCLGVGHVGLEVKDLFACGREALSEHLIGEFITG